VSGEVRGLADAIRTARHEWNLSAATNGRTDVDEALAAGALAWFDARVGGGEVVEAVARVLSPGQWWDVRSDDPAVEFEKNRIRRGAAAAAVEAVRAALREGE